MAGRAGARHSAGLAGLAALMLAAYACRAEAPFEPPPTAQPVITALESEPTREPTPSPPAPATALPPASTPPSDPSPVHVQQAVVQNAYVSQPGDTFESLGKRFDLYPIDLRCAAPDAGFCPQLGTGTDRNPHFNQAALIPTGTVILVPEEVRFDAPQTWVIPDSEVIFSAAATDFDVTGYVEASGGFLASHRQYLILNGWNSAAQVVELVAIENSINPRLLLALLEFQCGCVLDEAATPEPFLGAGFTARHDLYGQLVWAVHELSLGYYGWRSGERVQVVLQDGTPVRLHPALNAGTAAVYGLFAHLYPAEAFWQVLDPKSGFPKLFSDMFGDPWERERVIYPDGARQPPLDLPFENGATWSYTGGPHYAFEGNGPLAALDFAPASALPGCQPAETWATAAADGLAVRSEYGSLIQDLDGDGDENTGWVILYLHLAADSRVPAGVFLQAGDRIGLPSCEGGITNGTHLHIARKLNGEWIAAGSGPLPFNLGGWVAEDGIEPYKGFLRRGGTLLEACTCSWRQGWIQK